MAPKFGLELGENRVRETTVYSVTNIDDLEIKLHTFVPYRVILAKLSFNDDLGE